MTTLQLSEKTLVEVRPGQYGSPYVALGRIQGKSTRWVFLSSTAWQMLSSLIPEVAYVLGQGLDDEMRFHLNGRVLLAVSKFHDKHYVGMHSTDAQGQRVRGRGINLNMDEWRDLIRNIHGINHALKEQSATTPRQKRPLVEEEIEEVKKQKTEETNKSMVLSEKLTTTTHGKTISMADYQSL